MKNFRALLAWLTVCGCIALLVLVPDPIYPNNHGQKSAVLSAETAQGKACVGPFLTT